MFLSCLNISVRSFDSVLKIYHITHLDGFIFLCTEDSGGGREGDIVGCKDELMS